MKDLVKVIINDTTKEYPKGTTLFDISKEYRQEFEADIILALINNHLRELHKTVENDCKIRFVTTLEDAGRKTYVRGLIIVMLKAIYNVLGREVARNISTEYTVSNGLYCIIHTDDEISKEKVEKVKLEMKDIISRDVIIEKKSIGTNDAVELFNQYGMYDKEKLFKYRRVSKTNIYNLEGFEDYYYGYMPPSTGMLKHFDLMAYDKGLMLVLPSKKEPNKVEPFKPQEKLFYTLKEANKWAQTMEISTVGALNDSIVKGKINELILIQEALQETKISKIAAQIRDAGDKKFIMIAGPSSSGKTTFSHRLSVQLRTHGLNPHPIAVDNYFVERVNTPLDKEGNPDYESLDAIDTQLFNEDMTNLVNGKTVDLPTYNFKTGRREYKGNQKKLGPNDILVIEGIHGLNDKLSYSLTRESKYKIYISALTTLNVDEHNRISTTDGRLLRRMVRDARTRGASARDTIKMWSSVRRGEDYNIFPFQEDADVMFNSALIYELAVLKLYAEPLLFGINQDCPEYLEAKRLLKFLDYFLGLNSDHVPMNSILKEFVGGSCFADAH